MSKGAEKSFAAWMDLPGRLRVRFRPLEGVRVCYGSMVTWRDYYVLSCPAKSTTLRSVRARVSKAKGLPGKVLPVEAPNLGSASPKGP